MRNSYERLMNALCKTVSLCNEGRYARGITPKVLAFQMSVSESTAWSLLRTMKNRGWVVRERRNDDLRRNPVYYWVVSRKGRKEALRARAATTLPASAE